MLDRLELSQNPSTEQQHETRQFMREGLTNPKPIHVGGVEAGKAMFGDPSQLALHLVSQQLNHAEWLGSIEIYENGFNVFVRSAFAEHAVAVWRYRTEDGKTTE